MHRYKLLAIMQRTPLRTSGLSDSEDHVKEGDNEVANTKSPANAGIFPRESFAPFERVFCKKASTFVSFHRKER